MDFRSSGGCFPGARAPTSYTVGVYVGPVCEVELKTMRYGETAVIFTAAIFSGGFAAICVIRELLR